MKTTSGGDSAITRLRCGLLAVVAGVACGDSTAAPTPAQAVRRLQATVRTLCGAEYGELAAGLTSHEARGCENAVVSGPGPGRWWGSASVEYDPTRERPFSVRVRVSGPSSDAGRLQGRAVDVVAPALSADARDAMRSMARRLFMNRSVQSFQAQEDIHIGGNVHATAYTVVELDQPWERSVELRVYFQYPPAGIPTPDIEQERPVPPHEFASDLGAITPEVIAAWGSLCRDRDRLTRILGFPVEDPTPAADPASIVPQGRWTVGDMWLGCHANN